MDNEFVTAEVHREFEKRMEEENRRQNERLRLLEENVRQISELTASVKELAVSMKNMLTEQEKQGNRLEVLESRDGEMWRKVVGYLLTAVISLVVGFLFNHILF